MTDRDAQHPTGTLPRDSEGNLLDSAGAVLVPRIARAVPTDGQAQMQRLRESVRRAQDALTEKTGECIELQRKLADAELRIQQQSAAARDAALTAERALSRLQDQAALVTAAIEWRAYGGSFYLETLRRRVNEYNTTVKARS